MYIRLQTLEGKMLHGAREIHDADKNNSFVSIERTAEKWVYFKEIDPKNINKNEAQLQLTVTWENTNHIAGNEFGQHAVPAITVDGMYAMDAHSSVSSTGEKYYTMVSEVYYTEMEVKYDKKLLFGIHTKYFDSVKRYRSKGHVSLFKKNWLSLYEINKIKASILRDAEEAIRLGARLKHRAYIPAFNPAK